jgi:flavin reductase (DIM6/NTAB) family NADH-FMN oxidoreductase RutF
MSPAQAPVTAQEFRAAMGMFATGVTVVTTGRGDGVHAMTANAITSVSLNPPLLLFCVSKTATMAGRIRHNRAFTVSILDHSQAALSHFFAGLAAGDETPDFQFRDWAGGARLAGCAAAFACRLAALHDGGDHWIALGRVRAVHRPQTTKTAPLLFYQGNYHHLAQPG